MATEQQIAANRRNALLSTGPRTPEGKAAVRFNALTLGLSAKSIILNPGDQPNLERLLSSLAESFPEEDERYLIEEIAVTRLELSRLRALEVEAYTGHAEHPRWDEYFKNLEMISRMKVRLQRHYEKCAATLRRLHPSQEMLEQTQFVEKSNTPATGTPTTVPDSRRPIAENPIADGQPAAEPPEKTQDQTQFVEKSNTPATGTPTTVAASREPIAESRQPISEDQTQFAENPTLRPPAPQPRSPTADSRQPKAES